MVFFRSIWESESENMHLARLWREGSPERQLVALSAELRRSGLLLKNTIDSPSPSKRITKKYTFFQSYGKIIIIPACNHAQKQAILSIIPGIQI